MTRRWTVSGSRPRIPAIMSRVRPGVRVGADAQARRHLVAEDPREQWQIAGSVMPGAKPAGSSPGPW